MPKIYWAGDSTVKQNNFTTFPQTGIGQGMTLYLKKEILIDNHAENGRSTKSFIDEMRLEVIEKSLDEGDFLFIQFGHNDSKTEDPTRYAKAFGDYQKNLETFIHVAMVKKAHPVCITPLTRRWFTDEYTLEMNIQGDYPKAMQDTAKAMGVPCIDLYQKSRELLEQIGKTESQRFFMNFEAGLYENYPDGLVDNTHLRYDGAVIFASLIAKGLKELGGIYAGLLIDTDRI